MNPKPERFYQFFSTTFDLAQVKAISDAQFYGLGKDIEFVKIGADVVFGRFSTTKRYSVKYVQFFKMKNFVIDFEDGITRTGYLNDKDVDVSLGYYEVSYLESTDYSKWVASQVQSPVFKEIYDAVAEFRQAWKDYHNYQQQEGR